jgi:hypothetical protein
VLLLLTWDFTWCEVSSEALFDLKQVGVGFSADLSRKLDFISLMAKSLLE